MAKVTITIDQLAKMLKEGFRTTATKDEVAALHSEMNQKFEAVESRLDRTENLLREEQTRKIQNLEARMKKLEDALLPSGSKMKKLSSLGRSNWAT